MSRWFTSHTHDAASWSADDLLRIKGSHRLSVILPARNEAGTVGEIVTVIRHELMQKVPLVDEIIVMDSHSTDDTGAVAAAAGARVVHVDEALPEIKAAEGKGEALWRALAVMTGDIGVYIDADIEQFTSDFVTGLLGPLLTSDSIVFTKGFYDRPWNQGQRSLPVGGGRVTELVARPLITELTPELAGFVQPLSGEYAFRREAFEAVEFVSGYGVDIGLMIDVLHSHGLDAMAQVDLGRRLHSHQDLAALSVMAQQVRNAFELRLQPGSQEVSHEIVGVARTPEGRPEFRRTMVRSTLRPPMREVLAARRSRQPTDS